MPSCPDCDFPVRPGVDSHCRKCGGAVSSRPARGLLEVDIAHNGECWEDARLKIDRAIDQVFDHGYAGVRIIHGYGSTSGISIIGNYAVPYLKQVAEEEGGRFTRDQKNPGASLVWLNR